VSHVRIAARPEATHAVAHRQRRKRGCCSVLRSRGSASAKSVSKLRAGHSRAIVPQPQRHRRLHRNPDSPFPEQQLSQAVARAVGRAAPGLLDATGSPPDCSATRWRPICSCSASPISADWCRYRPRGNRARRSSSTAPRSIFNRRAFRWGRRAAIDRKFVAPARDTGRRGGPRRIGSVGSRLTRSSPGASRPHALQNAAYAGRLCEPGGPPSMPRDRGCPGKRTALADARGRVLFKAEWPTRTNTRSRGSTPTAIS